MHLSFLLLVYFYFCFICILKMEVHFLYMLNLSVVIAKLSIVAVCDLTVHKTKYA